MYSDIFIYMCVLENQTTARCSETKSSWCADFIQIKFIKEVNKKASCINIFSQIKFCIDMTISYQLDGMFLCYLLKNVFDFCAIN